ncbi:MAG: dihydrodipicolinate synthase family protein [Acidobacteria bacterium]|nr:dihydrodipicolinate synthase family protein [Acidobacteriota bacterium]
MSCEIPWDDHERFLEETFRQEVRRTLADGLRNVYIFGTAGAGYAVDTDRYRRIVEVFAEETRGEGIRSQVGLIALSTATVVERIAIAHRLGFRAFQISLPSWGALNDEELLRFFKDVCGAFPDSDFLHYNLGRSKRILTARDYRRIADAVPNLAATKITSTSVYDASALMRLVPEVQHFFGEALFPIGCLYGECSLLSSFGGLMPTRTREFFEYGRSKQFDKLFPMLRDYLNVVEDFLAPTSSKELIDGAYDKMLVRMSGIDFPLRLLSPYEQFPEETFEACWKILREKHGDWLG